MDTSTNRADLTAATPAGDAVPGVPFATEAELRARATFLALMWALSRPGEAQTLPPAATDSCAACLLAGEALLDLETTYFTPAPDLGEALARTGARPASAGQAAYHFYPQVTETAGLREIEQAAIGDSLYPDRSATLVVGCRLGAGQRLHLRGPGIPQTRDLLVDEAPAALWALRAERMHYPLGWDLFLVDGDQVVGLPRTTEITPAQEGA